MKGRGKGLASIPGCHDLIAHRQILCLSFPSSTVNSKSDRNCVGYHFKENLKFITHSNNIAFSLRTAHSEIKPQPSNTEPPR